ncbi:MAG: NifU family protein [Actinomycetota bacterium]|nr:NifU family protein [Actinomycetota bacterium]
MEFDQAVAELETLVETLERDGDERALMLLELMDAVHRPALELIMSGDADHPVAAAVLSMYDLGPMDDVLQVEEALDEVRPYIESHGGALELLDVDDGVVHVQMSGSCSGCAASAITLRRGVEEKLRERYGAFKEVVAHEPEGEGEQNGDAGGGLLQIEQHNGGGGGSDGGQLLQIDGLKRPVFVDAGRFDELPPDTLKAVDVEGRSILLANVDGEPYAFQNVCPVDGRSRLDGGRLTAGVLVCPWHNCAYHARSGKRADDEPDAAALAVVPVALRDGTLQVAVNVA